VRVVRGGVGSIVALTALVASGCGFNASPADGLQFQPPAGWHSSPGIMGFMQFWRAPADEREILMLFKSPRQLRPSDVFSDARLNETLQHVSVERREAIVICGNQPARYVEARGSSSNGEQDRAEMVMANAAGSTYFALYVRPLTSPPNAMAEAALRELCAKP
jgi:hypothetical protein